MAFTPAYSVVGPTVALSVANTSHAAVTVSAATNNEQMNYAAFLNTGTTVVQVIVSSVSAPAAVLATDGTPANGFVLPASMTAPMVVRVPAGSFSTTMIGSAAGPSVVYVTPLSNL